MSKKTFLVLNLSICLLLGGCSTGTLKEKEHVSLEDSDSDGVPDESDLCPSSPSALCSDTGVNQIDWKLHTDRMTRSVIEGIPK
jgi:hypothetical protein